MNTSRNLILSVLLFFGLNGCAKLEGPIQQALSNITRCEYGMEYTFPLPSVTNPLANFSATSIGGTARPLAATCDLSGGGAVTNLLPEHSITRSSSDLSIKIGTETVMALKLNANQLSGTLADTCNGGNRAIHTISSGVVNSNPKEVKVTISTKVVMSSCP
jgi:hypothetical protein